MKSALAKAMKFWAAPGAILNIVIFSVLWPFFAVTLLQFCWIVLKINMLHGKIFLGFIFCMCYLPPVANFFRLPISFKPKIFIVTIISTAYVAAMTWPLLFFGWVFGQVLLVQTTGHMDFP